MSVNIKYWTLKAMFSIGGLFLASIFYTNNANAESFLTLLNSTASSTWDTTSYYIGQNFRPNISGTITSADVMLSKTGIARSCVFYIGPVGTEGTLQDTQIISGSTKTNYTYSLNYNVNAGTDYHIYLACNGGDDITVYGDTNGSWDKFCPENNPYNWGDSCDNTSAMKDMYIQLNGYMGSSTISFLNTDYAGNVLPLVTTTCDGYNWQVQVYPSLSDSQAMASGTYGISVLYGTAPDVLVYNSFTNQLDNWSNQVYKIPKTTDLTMQSTYYAKAVLCNSSDKYNCEYNDQTNFVAQSDLWEFLVSSSSCNGKKIDIIGAPTNIDKNSTSSGSLYPECNYAWPINKICELGTWLFWPEPQAFDQFVELKNELQYKPPFGYATIYLNALNGLSTTTASSTIETPVTFSLGIFDTIKNIMNWIMYLAFAFYVFNRFKDLSLNG